MPEGAVTPHREPSEKEIRLVIAASSAGTIFEWYDFFIYGTLAALIGAAFFPSDNETLEILLVRTMIRFCANSDEYESTTYNEQLDQCQLHTIDQTMRLTWSKKMAYQWQTKELGG